MSDIETSYRVTGDELRKFIERIERLDAEKSDLIEQQKEVMAEAKGRGYDTKVMRHFICFSIYCRRGSNFGFVQTSPGNVSHYFGRV